MDSTPNIAPRLTLSLIKKYPYILSLSLFLFHFHSFLSPRSSPSSFVL